VKLPWLVHPIEEASLKCGSALLFWAIGLVAALPVAADEQRLTSGHVQVEMIRAPEMRLNFEVVVPAGLETVWDAFTTREGMVTWLAPEARIELRIGGPWEVGFAGAAPGGGTILAYLPREILAIHAMAPEAFPTVRSERTMAFFRFEPVSAAQTKVRLSQVGWKEGGEWEKAFQYLAKGNSQLLNALYERFEHGPIPWEKRLGKPAGK